MSTTQIAADPWHVQLDKVTRNQDQDARHAALATLLGLMPIENLPKGGHVAGWEVKDWEQWLKANGFEHGKRTTHGQMWHWMRSPLVFISVPATMGEPRAGMNMLRDLKGRFRSTYELLSSISKWLLTYVDNSKYQTAAEFAATALSYLNTPAKAKLVEETQKRDAMELASEEHATHTKKLLDVLKKEFDIPARKALRDTGIIEEAAIERIVAAVNSSLPFRLSIEVPKALVDLLEAERDIERAEKDRKKKERDAREAAQREAAKTAKPALSITKLPTPAEKHSEAIRKMRAALDHDFGKGFRLARELTDYLADRYENIDRMPYPPMQVDESEQHKKRVAELEADLAKANVAYADQVTQHDIDHQTMLSMQNELAKARKELLEVTALMEDPTHTDPFRLKYEGLVESLKPLLFGATDLETSLQNLTKAKTVVRGAEADIASLKKAEGKKP